MKIGLITGEFPPMEGGIGAFTAELAEAMAAEGHEIHILTHRRAKRKQKREPSKTVAEAFQRLGNTWEPQQLPYASLHPRFRRWHWGEMSAVADIAIRHELDILNVQYQAAAFNMRNPAINFFPYRVNSLATTVTTFHDLRVPYLFPKAGGLRKRVVYRLAKASHGIIVTNPANQKELQDQKITLAKQAMIPIGSNIPSTVVNHLEIADNREKLGLNDDHILLGYFGFLNRSKGASDLIGLMEQLDERFHLLFIGGETGSSDSFNNRYYLEDVKEEITAKGLDDRIHWTGFIPEKRVSAWLKTADMMVLPYQDGVSTRRGSLMAALNHGRPIISTQAELINPILKDGENMLLFPAGDIEAFKQKVNMLAEDRELAEKMGQAALEASKAFSWPSIAQSTIAFYIRILDTKNS